MLDIKFIREHQEVITKNNADILNNTMHELDIVGYKDAIPINTGLTDWLGNHIYSGMQIAGHNIWRFTPELTVGQTMQTVTVDTGNINGQEDVIFLVNGQTIIFPNAVIYTPTNPSSTNGAWVIQLDDAPAPYTLP